MEEIKKNGKDFIGYEYRDVSVTRDVKPLWVDSYVNFGWQLVDSNPVGNNSINLKFKRDRKIMNKVKLTRLQRKFESHVKEIESLEKSKESTALSFALSTGIIGTVFMVLAIFSYLGDMTFRSIFFALFGFIGWSLPYFGYIKIKTNKAEKVNPLIEEQYDKIYETCKKAYKLL